MEKGAIGYNERNHCSAVMTHITLTEAQQHLPEIIAGLTPGETIQIFQNDRPSNTRNSNTPKTSEIR